MNGFFAAQCKRHRGKLGKAERCVASEVYLLSSLSESVVHRSHSRPGLPDCTG